MTALATGTAVPAWSPGPVAPALEGGAVHVWRAALDAPGRSVASLSALLTRDEQERAAAFRFERDRRRWTVGRGLLRVILGRYLRVAPDQVPLRYGSHGKPGLVATPGAACVRFNLSHSSGLALYAVTRDRAIGVDVERVQADFPCDAVARQFFSPRENRLLRELTGRERMEGFFRHWTCREAYLKATGQGLSLSLEDFDVSLSPGGGAATLNVRGAPHESSRWSIRTLAPAPGYVAAVAVEGTARSGAGTGPRAPSASRAG
jgi:4'-phosphopantetheinyl transferase